MSCAGSHGGPGGLHTPPIPIGPFTQTCGAGHGSVGGSQGVRGGLLPPAPPDPPLPGPMPDPPAPWVMLPVPVLPPAAPVNVVLLPPVVLAAPVELLEHAPENTLTAPAQADAQRMWRNRTTSSSVRARDGCV